MTAVIEASSAGVRDMSDGSLRITFEFEPRHAAEAFALFGPRGRAVAIAALKDGAGSVDKSTNLQGRLVDKSAEMQGSVPKGGEWAKLAGMWCEDPDFWAFLNEHLPSNTLVEDADRAANVIRTFCGIKSRALLDSSPVALELFNYNFRHPFRKWMQARGISK